MKNPLNFNEIVFISPSAKQRQAASIYRDKIYIKLLDEGLKPFTYWEKTLQAELYDMGIDAYDQKEIAEKMSKVNCKILRQVFAAADGMQSKINPEHLNGMFNKVIHGTQTVREIAGLQSLTNMLHEEFATNQAAMMEAGELEQGDLKVVEDFKKIVELKGKYLELSIENKADNAERCFLISECAYDKEEKRIFESIEDLLDTPFNVVSNLMNLWLAFSEAPDSSFLLRSILGQTQPTGV